MSEENIAGSSSSNFSEQIHASPVAVAAAGRTVRPEEVPVPTNQVIETKGEMTAQHKPPALNPWPHIEDFYILESRNGQALTYHCVLCEPKEVIIKGHTSTLNNLKSHLSRNHPSQIKNFEDTVKAGSMQGKKRGSHSSECSIVQQNDHQLMLQPSAKIKRQSTVADSFQKAASGISVRQMVVDRKIVDMFVYNMLPLQVVESPTFVSLVRTLNPTKTSMSRRTLGRKIVTRHKQLEEYIIR
jgi:hypothetical protein